MNIDTDEDFPEHPKTVRFCAMLANPIGWAYLWKLWRWCAKFQPDGDLTGYEPNEIELSVGWTAMDGRFFAAAVKAGFIDRDERGTRVHNWTRRLGGSLVKMQLDRLRKAIGRAKTAGDAAEMARLEALALVLKKRLDAEVLRTSKGTAPDVQRTSDGQMPNGGGPVADFHGTAGVSDLICSDLICSEDPSLRACARDPRAGAEPLAQPPATSPVLVASPARRNGYDLQRLFAELRSEYLGGLPWAVPPTSEGKADAFAARLSAAEDADVTATMRLMFEHIRDEDEGSGWEDERYRSRPAFAFGSWMSRFTELREEIKRERPKRAAQQVEKYFDPKAQPR